MREAPKQTTIIVELTESDQVKLYYSDVEMAGKLKYESWWAAQIPERFLTRD
jgi:hypothetical protein